MRILTYYPWNFCKDYTRLNCSSHSSSRSLEVAKCLMVLSPMVFGFGLGKGSENIFITSPYDGGLVLVVALVDEEIPLVEQPNCNLLRNLCKFHSTSGSI